MMHGYVALDAEGELLVPFRTWRNTITGAACAELTPLLDFAVPQRWSIAHLYQSVLDGQPHVPRLARLNDAGRLRPLAADRRARRGPRRGVGDVPDRSASTGDWDAARLARLRRPGRAPRAGLDPARHPARRPAGRRAPPGRLTDGGRAAARPVRHAPGRDPAVPAGGRRRHGDGRDQRGPAAVRQRLRRHVGVRDDRPRVEPLAGPRGDRHRGHARRLAGRDGPLQQRLVRPRRLDRAVRPGRPGAGRRPTPDELYGTPAAAGPRGGPGRGRPAGDQLRLGRAHDRASRRAGRCSSAHRGRAAHARELDARPRCSPRCARCARASTSSPARRGSSSRRSAATAGSSRAATRASG